MRFLCNIRGNKKIFISTSLPSVQKSFHSFRVRWLSKFPFRIFQQHLITPKKKKKNVSCHFGNTYHFYRNKVLLFGESPVPIPALFSATHLQPTLNIKK